MQLASALSAIQEAIEAMTQKWEEKEKPKLMAKASKHWKSIKSNGESPTIRGLISFLHPLTLSFCSFGQIRMAPG